MGTTRTTIILLSIRVAVAVIVGILRHGNVRASAQSIKVQNKYDPFQRNLQNLWAPSLMLSSFVGKKFFLPKLWKALSVMKTASVTWSGTPWATASLSATEVLGADRKLEHERVIPSFLGVVNPNPF